MWNVRIRGGLEQQLRFHHLTDPAITRKRSIDGPGRQVAEPPEGRERSSRSGMELPLYDITTGTGDFIADGVVSHNCFARPTHEYLDLDAGRDFDKEIVVKVNVPEVLRAELARPSWKGEHVALGTNTDPYQWVEGRYKLMRGIWEAMRDFANPCSILTKSPLLLRDKDLLLRDRRADAGERVPVGADARREDVAGDASRTRRIRGRGSRRWRSSTGSGIPTGILIAPLMPGINDGPGQVEKIVELAEAAGATSIGGQALFLRGSTRDVFFDWLRAKRPDLVERYEQLYSQRRLRQAGGAQGARGAAAGAAAGEGRDASAFDRPPRPPRARPPPAAEAGGDAAGEPVLRPWTEPESSVTVGCRGETRRAGQCWLWMMLNRAATQVRRAGARPPGPLDHAAHDPARAPRRGASCCSSSR